MFHEDRCVRYAQVRADANVALTKQLLDGLFDALSFTSDCPPERILNAIKDEVDDLTRRALADVGRLEISGERARYFRDRAAQLLRPNLCYFPSDELLPLLEELKAPALSNDPDVTLLASVLRTWVDKHGSFEQRLKWLLSPSTYDEVQRLDPIRDCDQIYHYLTYEFRAESKLFSVLYELHPSIAPHISTFFLGTKEFTERAVRRIADTGLLFANMTEWGLDSKRGRFCIDRINQIHGRYHIHNDAFRFILSGIMFLPADWNARFGWRPWTDVERRGWFHTFAKLGRAMNIQDISDDYDAMKAWYDDYSRENATFSPVKRELFDRIAVQALSVWPENVRHLLVSALVGGMDDVYRSALGYPAPPAEVILMMRAAFFTIGNLCAGLPRAPWIRTLQSNVVYPHGPRLDELGVPRRSTHMPSLSNPTQRLALAEGNADRPPMNDNAGYPDRLPPIASPGQVNDGALPVMALAEVERRAAAGELLLIIGGFVCDVSPFVKEHPGGEKVLRNHAGKDATASFDKVGHSKEARTFMLNYRIARVAGHEPRHGGALLEGAPRGANGGPKVHAPQIGTMEEWVVAIGPALQAVKDYDDKRGFDPMSEEGQRAMTRELLEGRPASP